VIKSSDSLLGVQCAFTTLSGTIVTGMKFYNNTYHLDNKLAFLFEFNLVSLRGVILPGNGGKCSISFILHLLTTSASSLSSSAFATFTSG
jgi:hypothetical protein